MSKTKDELLSKLNELIEKYGYMADKEMLDKSIKEYDISSITDEELIKRCEAIALTIYGTGKKGSDLIYELAGRYKNSLLNKQAEAILQNANSEESVSIEESSNKEDENVKEMTIKTVNGDIPVKVIKLTEGNIKIISDVFSSFFTSLK